MTSDGSTINLYCSNTATHHGGNPMVVSPTSHNAGVAYFHPVQFNIGVPASASAVFVDDNNHGLCVAEINDQFTIADGSFQFVPGGSYTSDDILPVDRINKSISVEYIHNSAQQMTIHVKKIGADTGTVTLILKVNYMKNPS